MSERFFYFFAAEITFKNLNVNQSWRRRWQGQNEKEIRINFLNNRINYLVVSILASWPRSRVQFRRPPLFNHVSICQVGRVSFKGLSLMQLYCIGFESGEGHVISRSLIMPQYKVVGWKLLTKNPSYVIWGQNRRYKCRNLFRCLGFY